MNSELEWSDFDHVEEDRDHIEKLIKGALSTGTPGVNILVCGPPGTDKTEFCKTLAARLGTHLYSVGEEDDSGDEPSRKERLQDGDWMHLTHYIDRLAQAPIFIDDTPAISVFEARAKARRLHREYGLGMVVIDYLQLINRHVGMQSREQDSSHISRRLKDLAKELDVPVLSLVQLSCAVESRKDPRPQLSDLPEGIEQAADVVMFLYRPDMYGLTSPDGESREGITEIIIAKQRNGPPSSVYLRWNAESATYESQSV